MLTAIKNGIITCYTREEKTTHPVLLHFALGLSAIILGVFVDCSLLLLEEFHHLRSRYNGNGNKLLRACFSGISWTAVAIAVVVVVITLGFTFRTATYELTYLVIVIGLCPVVTHLMILPTKSEVYVSTVLEEKESYVGQSLAWSYYFNYLDKAVSAFKGLAQDQGEHVCLSLNKLIVLISNDGTTRDLQYLDGKIKNLGEISVDQYQFPVYRLKYRNGTEYTCSIIYAKQPLEALYQMNQYERCKALQKRELEHQVTFFYKTLSEILKDPFDVEYRDKCILVPINVKCLAKNGSLVEVIMQKVMSCDFKIDLEENVSEYEGIMSRKGKGPRIVKAAKDIKNRRQVSLETGFQEDKVCELEYKSDNSKGMTGHEAKLVEHEYGSEESLKIGRHKFEFDENKKAVKKHPEEAKSLFSSGVIVSS
ncbi:stimulator of interferon genes protein-like [Dendronephthya gigantea]|uniref:stimulator of interferon genes protein-like n=1 Tax=Dendronephthya gigantea TaxID=151771 RepID=UPI00106A80E3|nr:stimulator of interferon genes protein-like [Dendronephthya gigantea]